jgi:hypothetical protein
MENSRKAQQNASRGDSCPYIGLKNDSVTYSGYPSRWNICYHVKPTAVPRLAHQQNFCLRPEFVNCPVYQAPPGEKMPEEIAAGPAAVSDEQKKRRVTILVVAVGLLMILLAIVFRNMWLPALNTDLPQVGTETQVGMDNSSLVLTNEAISQGKSTPQGSATPSPTAEGPTITPVEPTPEAPDPELRLDTPIGSEYQFIIHRVQEAESLQYFADQYNTSVEAINAVNYNMISPLWIDWLIIIPLNTVDVVGLPAFEAYQIAEEGIPIKQLAEDFAISLEELCFYNNIDQDHILHQGEWVLLPWEKDQP